MTDKVSAPQTKKPFQIGDRVQYKGIKYEVCVVLENEDVYGLINYELDISFSTSASKIEKYVTPHQRLLKLGYKKVFDDSSLARYSKYFDIIEIDKVNKTFEVSDGRSEATAINIELAEILIRYLKDL